MLQKATRKNRTKFEINLQMLDIGEKKENPIKTIWRSFVCFHFIEKLHRKVSFGFVSGNFCTPTLNKDSSNDNNNKKIPKISKHKIL